MEYIIGGERENNTLGRTLSCFKFNSLRALLCSYRDLHLIQKQTVVILNGLLQNHVEKDDCSEVYDDGNTGNGNLWKSGPPCCKKFCIFNFSLWPCKL